MPYTALTPWGLPSIEFLRFPDVVKFVDEDQDGEMEEMSEQAESSGSKLS
jgi:hypothetical protein